MHFYVFNMLNYFYLAIQLNQGHFKTDDLLHLRGKLKLKVKANDYINCSIHYCDDWYY